MTAIQINNLLHSYKNNKQVTEALRGISVNIASGELFGFIGPDGAGKTTLFRIITSLLIPTQGEVFVQGNSVTTDYQKIRKLFGYMPGRFSLYQDLTVEENLRFFATLFNTSISGGYHLIKDIYQQLEPFKTRKAGALSGGMKQKLALCCALIHKPVLLVLDEPTTGVDVVSRQEFWVMLKKLQNDGLTIVVATPYMDEAVLCDRIALLHEGQILDTDTPANLVHKYGEPILAIKGSNRYQLLQDIRKHPNVISAYPFGEYLHVRQQPLNSQVLLSYLQQLGHENLFMTETRTNIEDVFIKMIEQQRA